MPTILLVDDTESIRTTRRLLLERAGYSVELAATGREALELLHRNIYDLVITDLKLGDVDGFTILEAAKHSQPTTTETIVITAYGTVEDGVEAMKRGAFDYIPKNTGNEEILIHVQKALETKQLSDEVQKYRAEQSRYHINTLVGNTPAMQEVIHLVRKIASSDSTVLLLGETGTGKSLVARVIHAMSRRSARPLVEINCAAIPDTLQESELFGHVKGAFTGAEHAKKGLIEEAHTGTVFLDEIGEMSTESQSKLLHFIEHGVIRRVGDTRPISVDARVIAATNRDLEVARKQKTFREDLYYRLNVITIHVPPLRARREDIPLLATVFLRQYADQMRKEVQRFTSDALDMLCEYHWPGNVRELENVVERAVLLSKGREITDRDLQQYLSNARSTTQRFERRPRVSSKRPRRRSRPPEAVLARLSHLSLAELEREFILYKLRQCGGNQVVTAEELGIGRTTLWRKLKQYGVLNDPGEKDNER